MIYFDQNGTGTFRGGIVAGNISSSLTTDLIISTSTQNTWITLYPAYNNGSGYPSVSYGTPALSVGYTLANNGEIDFINNYGMTGNVQYGITGGYNFYNRTGASTSNLLASIKPTGLTVNGSINCGNFNINSGIEVTFDVGIIGRTGYTTSLQVPSTGLYILSSFQTHYNYAPVNNSNIWGNVVFISYISGYAAPFPPNSTYYISLYSSNLQLSINASGYIVMVTPGGVFPCGFRVNYLRIA